MLKAVSSALLVLPVPPPGEVGNSQDAEYNDDNAAQRRSNGATWRLTTDTADDTHKTLQYRP